MNDRKCEIAGQVSTVSVTRLSSKPSLRNIHPELFGENGPQPKEVYEFFGEEGTGKSQTLLSVCAGCILPVSWRQVELGGHNVGVIFIDNDCHFNIVRLASIVEQRILKSFQSQNVSLPSDEDMETFIKQCLTKLFLLRCNSTSQLVITLHGLEGLLTSKPFICVLIIDSIGAFYWIDRSSGADSYQAQEANLVKAAHAIEKLKNDYKLTVFATKAAIFQKRQQNKDTADDGAVTHVTHHCEYLCRPWQRLVNHRWLFTRQAAGFSVTSDLGQGHRMQVLFQITETGLVTK